VAVLLLVKWVVIVVVECVWVSNAYLAHNTARAANQQVENTRTTPTHQDVLTGLHHQVRALSQLSLDSSELHLEGRGASTVHLHHDTR
jgi:hypothetical protein